MRIVVTHRNHSTDLDVAGLGSDATVGDLINAVWPTATYASIDGVEAPFDDALVDHARDGSTVMIDGRPPEPSQHPVIDLHALSGPSAGHVWQLGPGSYRFGAGTSIPLEGVDGSIVVTHGGDVSINGDPFPVGALRIGAHRLRIAGPPSDATPHPSARRSFFNRPPRHLEPIVARPIPVPSRDRVQGKPRRVSAILLILPVITGVAMALILGRMLFLAFALLGPITMVGTAIDDRRRRKRETRESAEKFANDCEAFSRELERRSNAAAERAFVVHPSVSELMMRARSRSQRLWERRPGHHDFLRAVVGYGAAEWKPPLAGDVHAEPALSDIVEQHSVLRDGPVAASFEPTNVLGISGDRRATQRLAADVLCQLAVNHGPVDLRVAIVTDDPTSWDWAKWLPHTASNQLSDVRLLGTTESEIGALLSSLRNAPADATSPTVLVVIDHPDLDDDQSRIVRECLAGVGKACAGLVLVSKPEQLPAACTEVVELAEPARFRRPHAGLIIDDLDPAGIEQHVALEVARSLAPLDDPESAVAGAGLPDLVRMLDLLDMPHPSAEEIRRRWDAGPDAPTLVTPVGASEAGPFTIDLVKDGPHALMAGTTGSGKSEFLRSLVAGLAANVSPDHLTFVLVDYKGGAAFDVCADLPHVVGLVTDLDDHLGERALQSLEAELHHREERLRDAGATDIDDYWAMRHHTPLPRLAVIVDEFATLAKELPDFMDALVDIAQRGRSLGVHMLLATQRPSGVIKDSIRANTNLRISLRVQTPADSKDVLNSIEAAALPRSKPGRGFARLGPGELVPFQAALSTVVGGGEGPRTRATPFLFSMTQPVPPALPQSSDRATDLERLVSAIGEAHRARKRPDPRRPWTEPLPEDLGWEQLTPVIGAAAMGLVDQPTRQRQGPWSWSPHDQGNLLLVGSNGWGPSDGLLAAALSLCSQTDSDQLHIYGIDHGGGRLAALSSLPQVGGVIPGTDIDRQKRLLRMLRARIDDRRERCPATTVLLLDGIASFKAAFDNPELVAFRDMLQEVAANGPPAGVFVAASADQNRIVPSSLAGSLGTRLVFNLADRLEYGMLGIRGTPNLVRRRAIDPITQEHVQIAHVAESDVETVAATASLATRTPEPILSLPTRVTVSEIVDAGSVGEERWTLPVGVDDDSLAAATIDLFSGDHLMVSGPGRSGRTTTLSAIVAMVSKLAPDTRTVAICPRPSALRLDPLIRTVVRTVDELSDIEHDGHTLIVADDAEDLDDPGLLSSIVEQRAPGYTIVAAGRTDALRGAHRHWTRSIRTGRRGIILRPFDSGDGDVLGIRLPRSARPFETPGRGYLVDAGVPSLIQVACP